MKKSLVAATVLLSATASTASAQFFDNNMRGSDTLFTFMNDLVTELGIADADLHYAGSGSGNGQTDIIAGDQELAPMSRFNNNAACTAGTAPATAGCWRVGRDLITIYGNEGSACDALVYNETLTVGDANGNGSVDCPGCTGAGSNEFSTSDWRTVLRVVFAGQLATPANTTRDCNSDIRHTLVNNWDTLFKDSCAAGNCTGGLRHAFRRDDFSGTTDSFLELLSLPANASTTPIHTAFCNGTDRDDNDPVRRPCSGSGFKPTGGVAAGEQICRKNAAAIPTAPGATTTTVYHLGLVLPVAIPVNDPYGEDSGAQANRNCGTSVGGGAAAGPVVWSLQDAGLFAGSSNTVCPNGAPVRGGNCQWPKVSGTGSTPGTGFGCVASRADRPAGSPLTLDARIYNLIARNNDGSIKSYQRGTATVRANRSFYKYQQLNGCMYADATENIACFANADECSIGFAGNSGLSLPALTDIAGIGLKNKTGVAATVYPEEADFAVYGLARFLYMCTWDDFASITNSAGTTSQTPEFVAAQQDIEAELDSPTGSQAIHDAMSDNGFLAFPANEALVFDQCPQGGI